MRPSVVRRRPPLPAIAAALLIGLAPATARALDFTVGGKEHLRLDLTESMFLSAHLDDGNKDPTTKNYGELINRLNAQLAWRNFLFFVRFDSGAWVHTPQPGDHSPWVSPPGSEPHIDCPNAPATDSNCVVQKDDGRLRNRFVGAGQTIDRGGLPIGVSAFYLEKIGLSYTDRNVEATLGDFYVNIGRGLVLSIRKLDELGVDTTISGGKLVARKKLGAVELSALALAGWTNIQNFDAARAQFTADPNDLVTAAHVDARVFDKVLLGGHVMFGRPACDDGSTCANKGLGYEYRLRPGVMIDAPRLTDWLGIYAEYARQQDVHLGKDDTGNAFYGAANLYTGPLSWLFEFKNYDHYLPWHASQDPFGSLVYMQPPTLEQVITQIVNNTDIQAGRLRLDLRVNHGLNLFVSGEYGKSRPSPLLSDTLFDFYAGAEIRWDHGHSHFMPTLGARHEDQQALNGDSGPDPMLERLYSVQWDGMQMLPGGFSLESAGLIWFRRKREVTGYDEWREGNAYLALKWRSKLVLSGGYEFTTALKEQANTHNFFNGSLLWNITSGTSLQLFVGGNRPGLKCVSGVCRDFPAFQGARLEFVLRL